MKHLIIVDIDNVHLRYKKLFSKMGHVFKIGVGVNVANVDQHDILLDKLIDIEVPKGEAISDLADNMIICELGKWISNGNETHGAGIISSDKRLVASFKKICDVHNIHFIDFTKYVEPRHMRLPTTLTKYQNYLVQSPGISVLRKGKTRDLAVAIIRTIEHSNEAIPKKVPNHKLEIAKCIIEAFQNKADRIKAFNKYMGLPSILAESLQDNLQRLKLSDDCYFDSDEKLPIGRTRVKAYTTVLGNIAQDLK